MNGIHQNHVEGQEFASHAAGSLKPIIVVGGGVVGCLTALKLAQAGIDVDIIEILPAPSKAPRACGYFAAVQQFLNELGVYKLIRDQGFMTRGLAWRNLPKGDGQGGKVLGDIVATLPLCARNDTVFEPGAGLLNLPQAPLNKLLLNEALKTGHVQVHFNTELVSIPENDTAGVTVVARDTNTGERKTYMAKYLVGTDGAHSATRKALGLSYPGHTWPERLIATDVLMKNVEDPYFHTHFAMDSKYFSISTPLADPVVGETTLWRFTLAADPHDTRTDDELLSDENIFSHYERNMPGPRPLQVQIQARAVYRTHQRLAPTMRRGNCLLAGDAAHCNHVSKPPSPPSTPFSFFSLIFLVFLLHSYFRAHAALRRPGSQHRHAGRRRRRRT